MSTGSRTQATRVALVDAYSAGRHLLPALDLHGAQGVHVRSQDPDVHLVHMQLPEGFVDDIRHEGDVAATASRLRELGVGRVIAIGETGVPLADLLSAELGTPGNGMSRPSSRHNKYDMVLALRAAGVVHAATIASSDVDEVVEWADTTAGYPVVLKPVSSAGRDNVAVCASAEEVRATHEKIMSSTDRQGRRNTVVLAQEFLAGDEYFVNSVSGDGIHRTVEIWGYHKPGIPGGPVIHEYSAPLPADHPDAAVLERYTHQVLDALEIRNGASHAEIMLTAKGPVLVECAARIGGGGAPKIYGGSLGANQIDLLAFSAADPEGFHRLPASVHQVLRHIRFVNLINIGDHGVAPSEQAMAEVRALPSFAHAVLAYPEGQPLPRTSDFATQPGYVILISDDADQLAADYRTLRELEADRLYAGAGR
jgi:biotin carboxylase